MVDENGGRFPGVRRTPGTGRADHLPLTQAGMSHPFLACLHWCLAEVFKDKLKDEAVLSGS